MRVLVLGGTHFVGRALAECATAAGHDVDVANRGLTGLAPKGTGLIQVDRTDHTAFAEALAGNRWDWVVDTWSGAPVHATFAAGLLGPKTGAYSYVSSRSVHSWPIPHDANEDAPLAAGDASDTGAENYAIAKRGGELGVLQARPDALIARAGLILGPYEDVGRLPWWLRRAALGGPMLAPGPIDRPLQYIDARDLAIWMMTCAQSSVSGAFNAVSAPGHTTIGELLQSVLNVTASTAKLIWLSPEEIEAAGVAPWTELPIWLPPTGDIAALHNADVSAAIRAGLHCRPIGETVADTWAWMQAEPSTTQTSARASAGLSIEREEVILSARIVQKPASP